MMDVSPEILEARERLKQRVGGRQQVGGKGTAQRKVKKVPRQSVTDERLLQQTMRKIGASNLNEIDEVRMYRADNTSMLFEKPKIQASPQSNTYLIGGNHKEVPAESLSDLINGLSTQDKEILQKLTEQMRKNPVDPNVPESVSQALLDTPLGKQIQQLQNSQIPDTVEDFDKIAAQDD